MPFYPVAIGLLKQILEEGLEGVRIESAMIRMARLNRVWFTMIIVYIIYIVGTLTFTLLFQKLIPFLTRDGVT